MILLLQAQLKKLEIKLIHFEQLEAMLEKERLLHLSQSKALIAERAAFNAQVAEAEGAVRNEKFMEFYNANPAVRGCP